MWRWRPTFKPKKNPVHAVLDTLSGNCGSNEVGMLLLLTAPVGMLVKRAHVSLPAKGAVIVAMCDAWFLSARTRDQGTVCVAFCRVVTSASLISRSQPITITTTFSGRTLKDLPLAMSGGIGREATDAAIYSARTDEFFIAHDAR